MIGDDDERPGARHPIQFGPADREHDLKVMQRAFNEGAFAGSNALVDLVELVEADHLLDEREGARHDGRARLPDVWPIQLEYSLAA